jgi:hypothetical protein
MPAVLLHKDRSRGEGEEHHSRQYVQSEEQRCSCERAASQVCSRVVPPTWHHKDSARATQFVALRTLNKTLVRDVAGVVPERT